jgi:hypothetical protein
MKRCFPFLLSLALTGLGSPAADAAPPATPAAVVAADFDALNRNDLDAFMALYAPQAQIFGLPTDPHRLVGPRLEQMYGAERLRAHFAKAMAQPDTPHIEQTRSVALGELVVSRVHIADPKRAEPQVLLVVYRVRDGLIEDLWHVGKETADNRTQAAGAVATAQALVEANNRADAEAFLALFAADARHFRRAEDPHQLADLPSRAVVDEASRAKTYRALYADGPSVRVDLVDAFAVGELVVTHERIRTRATATAPGEAYDMLAILRVRDGRVLDLWPLQKLARPADAAVVATAGARP